MMKKDSKTGKPIISIQHSICYMLIADTKSLHIKMGARTYICFLFVFQHRYLASAQTELQCKPKEIPILFEQRVERFFLYFALWYYKP